MTSSAAGQAPTGDEEALARCADEPIAVPGAVQPHGALLAVSEPDLAVVVASAGAADLFGGPVAGRALDELLDPADAERLRAGLAGDLAELNPLRVRVGREDVDLVVHRADGLLVTEWSRSGARRRPAAPGTAGCPRCCSGCRPAPRSTSCPACSPATCAR
ncbi:hypothetical protein [Blastococcus sp. DSM 46786]|uniref:hypothetical protein n=1 Tax=Blastococcus sp. DSM 46786 TaxID=1798227 RepID=UPI000B891DAD|nr:hypothetical protein [Blastococcus sp. DSM 46786]